MPHLPKLVLRFSFMSWRIKRQFSVCLAKVQLLGTLTRFVSRQVQAVVGLLAPAKFSPGVRSRS